MSSFSYNGTGSEPKYEKKKIYEALLILSKYNFNKVKNVIPVQKYHENTSQVTQFINEGNSRIIKLAQRHSEETDTDSYTGICCMYVHVYIFINHYIWKYIRFTYIILYIQCK